MAQPSRMLPVVAMLVLAGCAGVAPDLDEQAAANCSAYGFGPASDGHEHCLMTETQSLRAERIARNDALFRAALDTRSAPRLGDPLDRPVPLR